MMVEPNALRILVVNGKGGCGKTTIATNLAAAYARQGHGVALIDHDSQASSTHWREQRAPDQAPVHLVQAHQRTTMYATRSFQQRLPRGTDRIIIDTPSAVADSDLDQLLRGAQLVVVPVLPSSFDMRAAGQFLAQLMEHRLFRARPIPVATVANRVRPNTQGQVRLIQFLESLSVPTVATFRDRAIYTRLADLGQGVFDLPDDREAAAELPQWQLLLDWIDQAARLPGSPRQAHQAGPRPAYRNPSPVRKQTA